MGKDEADAAPARSPEGKGGLMEGLTPQDVRSRDAEEQRRKADVWFWNTFPGLAALPSDVVGRRRALAEHSILQGEASRYRRLFSVLLRADARVRRDESIAPDERADRRRTALHAALQRYYQLPYDLTDATFEHDREMAGEALKKAHGSVQYLLENFIPKRYRKNLVMISDVGTETDVVGLMFVCYQAYKRIRRNPGDIISRRVLFEGSVLLHLTQLEFEAAQHGLHADRLRRQMRRAVEYLEASFFVPNRSERRVLAASLNASDCYRVAGAARLVEAEGMGSAFVPTEHRQLLDLRFIRGRSGDIPVFFDNRVKDHGPLKQIRRGLRDPDALHDRLGLKFVFFSREGLLEGVDRLRDTIAAYPGCTFGQASNLAHAGILDLTNAHSSDEYRATKFVVMLFGEYFEVQIVLAEDWINESVSRGPENHDLYKLRSNLKDLLPRLWPKGIYGLDWESEELREACRSLQIALIG